MKFNSLISHDVILLIKEDFNSFVTCGISSAQIVLREVLVGATKTSSKTVFEVENGKITKNVSPIAVWRDFEI